MMATVIWNYQEDFEIRVYIYYHKTMVNQLNIKYCISNLNPLKIQFYVFYDVCNIVIW